MLSPASTAAAPVDAGAAQARLETAVALARRHVLMRRVLPLAGLAAVAVAAAGVGFSRDVTPPAPPAPVARFLLGLPEGQVLGTSGGSCAVAQWQRAGLPHGGAVVDAPSRGLRDGASGGNGHGAEPPVARLLAGRQVDCLLCGLSAGGEAHQRSRRRSAPRVRLASGEPRLGCVRHSGGAGLGRCDAVQSRGRTAGAAGEGRGRRNRARASDTAWRRRAAVHDREPDRWTGALGSGPGRGAVTAHGGAQDGARGRQRSTIRQHRSSDLYGRGHRVRGPVRPRPPGAARRGGAGRGRGEARHHRRDAARRLRFGNARLPAGPDREPDRAPARDWRPLRQHHRPAGAARGLFACARLARRHACRAGRRRWETGQRPHLCPQRNERGAAPGHRRQEPLSGVVPGRPVDRVPVGPRRRFRHLPAACRRHRRCGAADDPGGR